MTQQEALTLLKMGKNVFLTGSAGSGKTYVLNQYIAYLREHGITPSITASTGIAATHLGGMTIHAWAGIGIKEFLTPYDLDHLEQNQKLYKRLNEARVLIIDEVSMLPGRTLGMVDQVLRACRRREEHFGGLQVVLCGDFFQLPPVAGSASARPEFAFLSDIWHDAELHVAYLTEQYRHEDPLLRDLLNELRAGRVSRAMREVLVERTASEVPEDVPQLYTHNMDVDRINAAKLDAIDNPPFTYTMTSRGSKVRVASLRQSCLAPETLVLKEGAAVVFVKNNFAKGYVNGTLGTVVRFESGMPVVKSRDGTFFHVEYESWRIEEHDAVLAEVAQLPLRLAWAMTVHKSQGMTLDAAEIDLTRAFVTGQGYVALSRVRALRGLYLRGFNDTALALDPTALAHDAVFREESERNRRRLALTPEEKKEQLQADFVVRSGGSLEVVAPEKPVRMKKDTRTTYEKTAELIRSGTPLEVIIATRGMVPSTIIGHIEKLLEESVLTQEHIDYLRAQGEDFDQAVEEVRQAIQQKETAALSVLRTHLDNRYSYDELRFLRLFAQQ